MITKLNNSDLIFKMGKNKSLRNMSLAFVRNTIKYRYSYNFTWLGIPIIQFPQDMIAIQEIIWNVKPDLIIETGIAHGGSLILSASILEILGKGKVIGIDIDIRKPNKIAIMHHPLSRRINMIKGSSIDKKIVQQIYKLSRNKKKILVLLDSNHTHEHVLQELIFYSPLVKKGSYIVVFDTAIEDMPKGFFKQRNWDKGNNSKTAVHEFLKTNNRFKIDREIENKLLITVAPDGYLKCVRN